MAATCAVRETTHSHNSLAETLNTMFMLTMIIKVHDRRPAYVLGLNRQPKVQGSELGSGSFMILAER